MVTKLFHLSSEFEISEKERLDKKVKDAYQVASECQWMWPAERNNKIYVSKNIGTSIWGNGNMRLRIFKCLLSKKKLQ